MVENSLANAGATGDMGLIAGLGISPGGGHGSPLWYSCLGKPHEQRSLAGYSPWDCKESDMTEHAPIKAYCAPGTAPGAVSADLHNNQMRKVLVLPTFYRGGN